MAKQKISITIDSEIVGLVETLLNDVKFRNRSHVIECSLNRFLKDNKNLKDHISEGGK